MVAVGWLRLGGCEGGSSRGKGFGAWEGDAVGAIPAYEGGGALGGETRHSGNGDVSGIGLWDVE